MRDQGLGFSWFCFSVFGFLILGLSLKPASGQGDQGVGSSDWCLGCRDQGFRVLIGIRADVEDWIFVGP